MFGDDPYNQPVINPDVPINTEHIDTNRVRLKLINNISQDTYDVLEIIYNKTG